MLQAFPQAPPETAETAFTDTVLELHKASGEPDALSAPWSLIRVRCWRRLRALVRSERARQEREGRWAETQRREAPLRDLAAEQRAEVLAGLADQIRESLLDERMRITFDLWLEGERETAVYAEALGLEALPVAEQRRAVKRERDRLRVFLRRRVEAQNTVLGRLESVAFCEGRTCKSDCHIPVASLVNARRPGCRLGRLREPIRSHRSAPAWNSSNRQTILLWRDRWVGEET